MIMRICFVIDNIFPCQGGIGRTTERQAKLLKARGHQIVFLSSFDSKNKQPFQLVEDMPVYRLPGVKVPFTKNYYQALPSKSKIINILKKEKIDLVIIVSYTLLAFRIQNYSKRLSIPTVVMMHSLPDHVTHHIHLDYSPLRKAIGFWLKILSDRSDLVVTPTEFSKNIFLDYKVKQKIEVVSNGIDLKNDFNRRNIDDQEFRAKFNLTNKRFFLFMGRLMPEKNISLILQAASQIKLPDDFKIVIGGEGDEKPKLIKLARSLGLTDKIIFTGWLEAEDMKSAFKSCDALIHPSLVETEGMVVLEAMALAKPVLVAKARISASSSFVDIGQNGYVFHPKNPQQLADLMSHLIQNPKKIKQLGKNSLKLVQNYEITESINKLENLFLGLVN